MFARSLGKSPVEARVYADALFHPLPLPADPRACGGCGGTIDRHEGGRCAFCRMRDRGDNTLLAHDDRGWEGARRTRVLCECGCGMTEVPEPAEDVSA